jgi:U6 snRNA-associated Sm-like protein LSm5
MTTILPLMLLDKAISAKVWILMRDEREFEGTLCGFDDFFSKINKIIKTWF